MPDVLTAGNVPPEAVRELENAALMPLKLVLVLVVPASQAQDSFSTGVWQLPHFVCVVGGFKPLIADGGIHHGDVTKSVRFGATMVIIGSMLTGRKNLRWRH